MVCAVAADHAGLVVPAQVAGRFESDECRLVVRVFLLLVLHELLREKGNADCSHFARAFRSDGDDSRELFEGAENRVVLERSALDHDDLSEGFKVADADDFRENVQDDGTADARDDVFGLLAVALLGDYRAVHEDRAATSEFGGVFCVEGEFRDLFHGDA